MHLLASALTVTSALLLSSAANAQSPKARPADFLSDVGHVGNQSVVAVTPSNSILEAVSNTNQTSGPPATQPPAPIAPVTVATNTSAVVDTPAQRRSVAVAPLRRNRGNVARALNDYQVVSDGTDPVLSKAALQAPAYLTYSVIRNNATLTPAQRIAACAAKCDREPKCVSFNVFKEWNNPLLDYVFSEKSNIKCSLFGDVAVTSQLTNVGGQQLKAKPEPLTKITDSAVYTRGALVGNPATPAGYDFVFGPLNSAINGAGYMGYRALSMYDVQACANECNNAQPDALGGACNFFNIWRGVVDGAPTTFTCSLYYQSHTASEATNAGDASVKVTYSRGYALSAEIKNSGFEDGNAHWSPMRDLGNYYDIPTQQTSNPDLWRNQASSHMGSNSATFASTDSTMLQKLQYAEPLRTVPGRNYKLRFYLSNTAGAGGSASDGYYSAGKSFEVLWNGRSVFSAAKDIFPFTLQQVTVAGSGSDTLAFQGYNIPWAYVLDDVSIGPA